MIYFSLNITDKKQISNLAEFWKPGRFQEIVHRNIKRWVNYASDWLGCRPFPGEVTIAKDRFMRRFQSLKIFIGLEESSGKQSN